MGISRAWVWTLLMVGLRGKKRDASELENGLDPEFSFGITLRRIGPLFTRITFMDQLHLSQLPMLLLIRDYSLESALIIHAHCFSPNRYRLCEAIESNIKIWDLESKSIVVDLKVNMKQEFEMAAEGTTTQTNDRKTKAGLKEKALGPHTGGKSETWVNGESIGHYWPSYSVPNSYCADSCSYKGHMVGKMPRELQETVSGCNFQVESTKNSSLETYVLCVQPLLEKGIFDHSILHMTLVQYFTIAGKLFLLFNI
ncbi:hypothetical protein L6452_42531 [Arctium lappa]|uniref:Uncharacterized protein n=1 Tax=Arctium lappa TaxID=4217 RepID=A0ACB8XJQ2_ARCLA|nr:hypothetical protein L6452_42531 [Arctium lappa]